jgi:hypothetical protein
MGFLRAWHSLDNMPTLANNNLLIEGQPVLATHYVPEPYISQDPRHRHRKSNLEPSVKDKRPWIKPSQRQLMKNAVTDAAGV